MFMYSTARKDPDFRSFFQITVNENYTLEFSSRHRYYKSWAGKSAICHEDTISIKPYWNHLVNSPIDYLSKQYLFKLYDCKPCHFKIAITGLSRLALSYWYWNFTTMMGGCFIFQTQLLFVQQLGNSSRRLSLFREAMPSSRTQFLFSLDNTNSRSSFQQQKFKVLLCCNTLFQNETWGFFRLRLGYIYLQPR